MFTKKKIMVMFLEGVITANPDTSILRKKKTSYSLANRLNTVAASGKYAGILLRINSPGGTAGASEELANTIVKIREKYKIPIIASVIDIACSGAYMVAASCDYIFANHMSLLGSIGVIMQIPNYTELSKKLGATLTTIKAGKMKDIGNPTREMTEEEHVYLDTMLKKSHEFFINLVCSHREIKNINEMTDGRIIDANTALENNLIDAFGSYDDALAYLIKLVTKNASADKSSVIVEEDEDRHSLLRRLLETANSLVSDLNSPLLKI